MNNSNEIIITKLYETSKMLEIKEDITEKEVFYIGLNAHKVVTKEIEQHFTR